MIKARYFLITLCLLVCSGLHAQRNDSIAVVSAVNNFVVAFNNFNWPVFRASFADDATMFHPFWKQARRIKGRQEVEAAWLTIFPEFQDAHNTRKLQISPKDVNIQLYGQTAIVTFHLGDGVHSQSRRTLVMIKKKRNWKIVHLHASSVSEDKN